MMICFGKQPPPPDSQTGARSQPGHYVNAKGSLMPGKFECEIPDICGSVPGAVPSEADKSAEGKGITSSSVFAPNCFQWKGQSRIRQDLFTRPRHFSSGESRQNSGKWNKACINLKSLQREKKKRQLYNLRRGKVDSLLMEKPFRTLPPLDMVSAVSFYNKTVPACLPTANSYCHHGFFNQMGPLKERFRAQWRHVYRSVVLK